MSRIVGPKMTKENYFNLLSMILSSNESDQQLAVRLCNSFRGDSTFLYYGSLLLKRIYKIGIESLANERWTLFDKIKKVLYRKANGTDLINNPSWNDWFWSYDYQESDKLIKEKLEKILDQLKVKYDKLD